MEASVNVLCQCEREFSEGERTRAGSTEPAMDLVEREQASVVELQHWLKVCVFVLLHCGHWEIGAVRAVIRAGKASERELDHLSD